MASQVWLQGANFDDVSSNSWNIGQQIFKVKPSKKGLYVDGHKREDVVQDRQERFLPEIQKIMEECVGVRQDENGVISIVNEDAAYILISVDQKAHKSNERPSW